MTSTLVQRANRHIPGFLGTQRMTALSRITWSELSWAICLRPRPAPPAGGTDHRHRASYSHIRPKDAGTAHDVRAGRPATGPAGPENAGRRPRLSRRREGPGDQPVECRGDPGNGLRARCVPDVLAEDLDLDPAGVARGGDQAGDRGEVDAAVAEVAPASSASAASGGHPVGDLVERDPPGRARELVGPASGPTTRGSCRRTRRPAPGRTPPPCPAPDPASRGRPGRRRTSGAAVR